MADWWQDFLTGATGLASVSSGGLLPIYGEPAGTSWWDRVGFLTGGALGVASDLAENPAAPLYQGGRVVGGAATAAAGALLGGVVDGVGEEGGTPWLLLGGAAVVLLLVVKLK